MVEIYTPATKEVKDYGLGKTIETTINGQAVIPILADKIYKSPYSAIRELYVNEVTAVKKALRINPKLSPEIHIDINTNTREMKIKGVDSLGIDTDTFKYILAVMGNSGNNNEDETGYYGLGFYSFVKLSERIIINSYSLESGEKWACIAKSALKFEQLPKGSFKPLDKTGFEITLIIKNDLDMETVTNRIKEISKLSGVKTILNVDEVYNFIEQYDNLKDYFKKQYHEYFEGNANYSIMYKHINNDDYEIIIGYKSGNGGHQLKESFLINVPIELEFYHTYHDNNPQIILLNVKNERKFKPSADRERFNEDDENILKNILRDYYFNPSENLTPLKTLDELYKSEYRYFYDEINNTSLLYKVKNLKEKDYYDRYRGAHLKYMLPVNKPDEFRISKTLRKKAFKNYEEKNIYAAQVFNSYEYDNFIKLGFVDIDHGKKKHKKRSNSVARKNKNFKFHNYYGQTYDKSDIEENDIVIRVDNVKDISIRNVLCTNMYLITQNADYDNAVTIDELPNLLNPKKIYATNKGFLTTEHILELANKFQVYKNTNYDYEFDDTYEDKFMMKLYNFRDHDLIVRFDNSEDSNILQTILKIKQHYLQNANIDFDGIRKEETNQKYQEWKESITDIRLKSLFGLIEPEYNPNYQQILTSLQESLK